MRIIVSKPLFIILLCSFAYALSAQDVAADSTIVELTTIQASELAALRHQQKQAEENYKKTLEYIIQQTNKIIILIVDSKGMDVGDIKNVVPRENDMIVYFKIG